MQPTLPIWRIHSGIVNAVNHNNSLVLIAPTGSGKTTQVPQMLLDDPARPAAGPSGRDRIVILQGAANHDPRRFERADELDVRRQDNTPLSFGWGIHHRIGATLARMEGEIAFNALLARFGTLAPAEGEPRWRPGFTLRGLLELPLRVAGQ